MAEDKGKSAEKGEEIKEKKGQSAKPAKPKKPTIVKPNRKKLSHLSFEEVEAALENAREKMGGYHSAYAKSLLGRRDLLLKGVDTDIRKAA